MAAWKRTDAYAACLQLADGLHFRFADSRDELKFGSGVEIADGVCEIEGSASGHVCFAVGRYDFVKRDMSDAANFFHERGV